MTSFTDLHIRTAGFGPYHINRFRLAFRSDFGIPYLANLLVHGFPGYFNGPGGHCYRLEGDKLKFFGNLSFFSHNVPTPHPDWVRIIYTDPLHGFTVQTLHRDSIALDDLTAGATFTALGAGAGAAAGTPIAGIGALPGALIGGTTGLVSGVSLNRRHFLAGRRAWTIDVASSFAAPGDGENFPKDALIIETAAIERYSAAEFWALQQAMTPVVTELWSHMLMKFATATRARILPWTEWPLERGGWQRHGLVHYLRQQFGTVASSGEGSMRGSMEFNQLQRLYPRIYEDPSGR